MDPPPKEGAGKKDKGKERRPAAAEPSAVRFRVELPKTLPWPVQFPAARSWGESVRQFKTRYQLHRAAQKRAKLAG